MAGIVEERMKYGFSWDRVRKQLTLSTPLSYLVIFENVVIIGLIVTGIISQFAGK